MRLSSVVVVPKSRGRIRICVDFRDLNKACPKDEFPLPILDIMVDAQLRIRDVVLHGRFFRVSPNQNG